jgi:ABC-type transport system involved in cytochrome bd biosynthesis fused ATPase/permease subunit
LSLIGSLIGFLLMVSGWILALSALLLLTGLGQRFGFVLAALLVELLGLALVAHRYRSVQRGPA